MNSTFCEVITIRQRLIMGISRLLKRFIKIYAHKQIESPSHVGFDEEIIWVKHYENKGSLLWKELIGVAIRTKNNEPRAADVFWILGAEKKVLTYPDEANGEIKMLKRLQKLPGFNNEAVISAMSCTENRTFICWTDKDFSLKIKRLTNQKIEDLLNYKISLGRHSW